MNLFHDHEHKCPENALETYKALTKHLLVAYKVITNQGASFLNLEIVDKANSCRKFQFFT